MEIEMRGINKSFGNNAVLNNAGFVLSTGEIHALMGENGAGKSTLMKILTGVYTKDVGQVIVDGQEVCYKNAREAEKAGIVFIHQELNVLFDLTVEENMFLGKEIKKKCGVCDKKAMRREGEKILKRLGVEIDPGQRMEELSVGQQQMVEIAKALMVNAKVIIMDEPTAALTQSETRVLFEAANALRERGVSIVYISHRMEEIFELCDRITILRDGTYIDTKKISETDMNDVVKMMIGREIGERYPQRNVSIGDRVLEVKNLTCPGVFEKVSFEVHAGEVLGVSGLMGAGRTELMMAVFGAAKLEEGEIEIGGVPVRIQSPKDAIRQKIALVTEDRKRYGLNLTASVEDNAVSVIESSLSKFGFYRRKLGRKAAEEMISRMNTKVTGMDQIVGSLSGGNMQKVVLSKWLLNDPDIIIFDEPTRGIDVGAKAEIYKIIEELACKGKGIIIISSEMPELIGLSQRIIVLHEGEQTGELRGKEMTQENIMTLASGYRKEEKE